LEALELWRRTYGLVAWAARLGEAGAPERPVVWAPSERERAALRGRLGEALRAAAGARPRRGGEAGLLERAGVREVLVRVPIEGGEAGLAAEPGRPGVRVRILKGGRPDSFHEAASALSIDAAVEGAAGPQAAERAAAAADRLYRALASRFSCPVAFGLTARVKRWWARGAVSGREEASLSHLRDYLTAAVAGGGPSWARSLPLFESASGWRSHDALAEAVGAGGVLVWGDRPAAGTFHRPDLDVLFGRPEGERRMPKLFPGLVRCPLDRMGLVAWIKAPPRVRCSHGAPFGCLAEGSVGGSAVHLAVSPKGRVLLYPVSGGEPRGVGVAQAGRLAYDAAVAAALRTPACLSPGGHPWRMLVLSAAARWLAPWPGKADAAALRALLLTRLEFEAQWGQSSLDSLAGTFAGSYPAVYVDGGPIEDPARYRFSKPEQAMLKAVFPRAGQLLQTVAEHGRFKKALEADPGTRSDADRERALRAAKPAVASVTDTRAGDLPSVLRQVGESCGSWSAAARFALAAGKGKALVSEAAAGGFTADSTHPAASAALGAGLPEGARLAYLASAVHTALNRLKEPLTDADDAKFQAALAAWAADDPD
jgi:hypothetical protein